MNIVTDLLPVGVGIAFVRREAESAKRVSAVDMMVGMHETGAVSSVTGVAEVGYQRVDTRFDELVVDVPGAVPLVVVSYSAMGVRVGACDPRYARRATQRRSAIGIVIANARRRQAVHVRGLYDVVTVTAGDGAAVLVGHDEEYVGT